MAKNKPITYTTLYTPGMETMVCSLTIEQSQRSHEEYSPLRAKQIADEKGARYNTCEPFVISFLYFVIVLSYRNDTFKTTEEIWQKERRSQSKSSCKLNREKDKKYESEKDLQS
jgi:hypothetical protein